MHLLLAPLAVLMLALPVAAAAQSEAEELFAPARAAREQAEAAEAALLAPAAYARAVAALERAQRDWDGGAGRTAVEPQLAEAGTAFATATRSAREARRAFEATLARREAAREAEAFRLATTSWAKAEGVLAEAARRLEKTDVDGALARGAEAATLFDAAELAAIKATLLTEARRLVVGLDPAGTAKLAPKTTERAGALLRQAEAELDGDRTRRDEAARLAQEAADEARHAVALAAYLRSWREADATAEDLALAWEDGLRRAAAAAGGTADLAAGPPGATDGVVGAVTALQERATEQARELTQRDRQIAALEEEIRELDARLAGASSEARDLTERLEARERARAQFEQLERVFPTDQAVVFRQGDAMIVRAHGLSFASGSARLSTGASPMLAKLAEVVAIYPGAQYTVEGHTDSSGDSGANQRLSQSRAEAVRTHLVGELKVPAGRVTAIGYGDSRPIAKNETSEGRRLNRRIDLVITPREGAL
jgi:outer membrane protein OmpA-like peptidoglycan-associated protein